MVSSPPASPILLSAGRGRDGCRLFLSRLGNSRNQAKRSVSSIRRQARAAPWKDRCAGAVQSGVPAGRSERRSSPGSGITVELKRRFFSISASRPARSTRRRACPPAQSTCRRWRGTHRGSSLSTPSTPCRSSSLRAAASHGFRTGYRCSRVPPTSHGLTCLCLETRGSCFAVGTPPGAPGSRSRACGSESREGAAMARRWPRNGAGACVQPNRLVSCPQAQILMEPRPHRW